MNYFDDDKKLNQDLFRDVDICTCGAHTGVYVCREEDGWYYRCNDCDLPIKDSFHRHEPRRTRYVDEYED